MDALCPSRLLPSFTRVTTTITTCRPPPPAAPLVLLWHLAVLSLPILSGAQYSYNPSTDWALSSYPGNYSYRNITVCNNGSSNLELLNVAQGLSGRTPAAISPHDGMQYTVYFGFYFVTPAENVCTKVNAEGKGTIPAYYLSLVALNANGRTEDPNKGQVVWTANPMNPVTENACLRLDHSNLRLFDHHDNIGSSPQVIWQISTDASDVSLVISFEGNLVLFSNTTDPPYVPLWESFGHPTDTLMALQVLQNKSTLTVNSSPASNSGNYTLALEKGRLVLYAKIGPLLGDEVSPYGSPYWFFPNSSILANDNISFAAFCWDSVHQLRLIAGSDRPSNVSSGYRGMVSPEFCSTISNNSVITMQITGLDHWINATFATFLRLEADGDLRAYTVDNTTLPGSSATWRAFYNVFNNTPCALPLYCGSYGMCVSQGEDHSCRCDYNQDPKLVFADASDTKSGCNPENGSVAQLWDIRNISSSAQAYATIENIAACAPKDSACEVEFFQLDNVSYFSLSFSNSYQGVQDSDACREECQQNSSCTAAFWNQSTSSCFLVLGRLGTIQKQQQGTMQAFIKYVKITKTTSSNFPFMVVVIASVLAAAFLVVCIFFLAYWQRRGDAHVQEMTELQKERVFLLSLLDVDCGNTEKFTWKQMLKYTNGFSCFLGGGGFGGVFRGTLPDGTVIAVKQLDEHGSQSQGNKEFIAEVSILSRIHHAHLVRLIGFCLEGMHRLLVYEYMENGSLDAWLFQGHVPLMQQQQQLSHSEMQHGNMNEKNHKRRELLPWRTRFQIALGTAKGLAYLHEECEQRVIHMDFKPQNILLGRNFQAKISDFGMSKRTGREQSSVMTVMRGTPGYLAPEWLVDCAITEKCDVYSFGIVLLEMVSGKKVKDVRAVKQKLRMRPLRESVMLDLLDESLRHGIDGVEEKEAVRMVEVALMCVRRDPTKRPGMSGVAWMLEGREEVVQDGKVLDIDDEDVAQQRVDMFIESLSGSTNTNTNTNTSTNTNTNTNIWDSSIHDDNENLLGQRNSKKRMHMKYVEHQKQQHEPIRASIRANTSFKSSNTSQYELPLNYVELS